MKMTYYPVFAKSHQTSAQTDEILTSPEDFSECQTDCLVNVYNEMLINISEVSSRLYHIYVNHKSCVCDMFDIAMNVAKP